MLWFGEMAGEAHADECVGQLFEGVRQPLVVCFEWMTQWGGGGGEATFGFGQQGGGHGRRNPLRIV